MLEQAVVNDLIVKNPAKGVKLPTVKSVSTKRALTATEESKIHSLKLDSKTMCYVFLLMYTGMRKSEALAITKNDIDWNKSEISVNKTLVFMVNKSVVKHTPKTDAGVRRIPILKPLRDVLFNYVNSIDSDFLFETVSGETFSATAYRRLWAKFEKAVGTKEITAHIFRHNFATILYNAGVDLKSAQQILGHKSILVIMDIYTHLDESKKQKSPIS
jgi:integrase